MGTHCYIGKVNEDKTVTSIYVHYDGSLEWTGRTLYEHYSDPKQIDRLLALGNLSAIGKEPKSDPISWDRISWFHNADADDWCVAYKDRGDDGQEAKTFNSVDEWKKFIVNDVVEYAYLYEDDRWLWTSWNYRWVWCYLDESLQNI